MSEAKRGAMNRRERTLTRRRFLKAAAGASAGALLLGASPRAHAANERLDLALIGAGGRGDWFSRSMPGWRHNLVALCDVDPERASKAFALHAGARRFADFRELIDTLGEKLDGVIVATPDHTHAVAAACALRAGLPVYCEKPLAHGVGEARALGRLAAEKNVATQMGNQGTASHAFHSAVRHIRAGTIGAVKEVYAWNTGGNGQLTPFPETPPVPAGLEWDLWLGPAPARGYHPKYLRGGWHPWADFGTGVLGNWACHTLNLPFHALRVGDLWDEKDAEIVVAAEHAAFNGHTLPGWLELTWSIPARGDLPPLRISWANGSANDLERLGHRKTIEDLTGHRLDWTDTDGDREWKHWAGVLVVGEQGMIHANAHNTEMTLLPEKKFAGIELPGGPLPHLAGHEAEWFAAIKGGARPASNFTDHGGPLSELVLLGNIVCRVEEPRITYRPADGVITGGASASSLLLRAYREGWTL